MSVNLQSVYGDAPSIGAKAATRCFVAASLKMVAALSIIVAAQTAARGSEMKRPEAKTGAAGDAGLPVGGVAADVNKVTPPAREATATST